MTGVSIKGGSIRDQSTDNAKHEIQQRATHKFNTAFNSLLSLQQNQVDTRSLAYFFYRWVIKRWLRESLLMVVQSGKSGRRRDCTHLKCGISPTTLSADPHTNGIIGTKSHVRPTIGPYLSGIKRPKRA
jgi:hypothetical protein